MLLLKKILLALVPLLPSLNGLAQLNLVPNPSFEDTVACPWTDDLVNYAIGWYKPTPGTSDLLHSCSWGTPQNYFGFQAPRTGEAYAGLYGYHPVFPDSSYREYISISLSEPLVQGYMYHLEFYVSRADSSNYACKIGAYISSDSIFSSSIENLNFIPQCESTTAVTEKTLWEKLSCDYIASGGEQFLTIGNFKADIAADTINMGDGGDTNIQDYMASYYYIDDISLIGDSTNGVSEVDKLDHFALYPNPTSGSINIRANINFIDCQLFDIQSQNEGVVKLFSPESIDISDNPAGMYLLRLVYPNQVIHRKILLSP